MVAGAELRHRQHVDGYPGLTNEQIIELGAFAGQVLNSPYFVELTSMWETQCVDKMLQTKPTETADREYIYTQMTALRDFFGFLADFAGQSAELSEKYYTPKHTTDDPEVHDIYDFDAGN